jgi:hypothetical protein
MTDISPQWRYMAMTETFGPCGIGWRYEIAKLWIEPGTNGQMVAFAHVLLYVKQDPEAHRPQFPQTNEWSFPIPGVGGSMFIAEEKNGLRTSDEAYKMAVTDALSVSMKQLGVAADIYMNLWDGSKYKDGNKPKDEPEIAPTIRIDPKVKAAFAEQIRECLSRGDEMGLKSLWAEWANEEKLQLWSLFNSQERAAMKALKGDS